MNKSKRAGAGGLGGEARPESPGGTVKKRRVKRIPLAMRSKRGKVRAYRVSADIDADSI